MKGTFIMSQVDQKIKSAPLVPPVSAPVALRMGDVLAEARRAGLQYPQGALTPLIERLPYHVFYAIAHLARYRRYNNAQFEAAIRAALAYQDTPKPRRCACCLGWCGEDASSLIMHSDQSIQFAPACARCSHQIEQGKLPAHRAGHLAGYVAEMEAAR